MIFFLHSENLRRELTVHPDGVRTAEDILYVRLCQKGFNSHTCILHFYYHSFTMYILQRQHTILEESRRTNRRMNGGGVKARNKIEFYLFAICFFVAYELDFLLSHLQCTLHIHTKMTQCNNNISNLLFAITQFIIDFSPRIEVRARLDLGHDSGSVRYTLYCSVFLCPVWQSGCAVHLSSFLSRSFSAH